MSITSADLKKVRAQPKPTNLWEIWPVFAIACGKGREEGKNGDESSLSPTLFIGDVSRSYCLHPLVSTQAA
jgi:hypothetical protein